MNELNLETEESRKESLSAAMKSVLKVLATMVINEDEGNQDEVVTDFINKLMGLR